MGPEILAPAGSMEALRAAVYAGADAVYLGGNRFGARAFANNFDEAALIEAIEYCHLYGVKVYLTINTLFRNEEIRELGNYLLPFYEAGLDAVIVQDFGVMKYVHTLFPDLAIHASTQMTITTHYAYELLKDYGVTRIVPARELSVEEIADLKVGEWVPEVEVFVQGALCYCYSGQCLMSSMLGGRSGNRGRCAQTCRLPYQLYDEEGNVVDTRGEYILSPKDLCGLEAIPDLIKAGVDSFKIEGRMKRPEYVAVCVRAYRALVDAWYAGSFSVEMVNGYKAQMAEVFNRGGFTEGYYEKKNGRDMMSLKTPGNIGVTIGRIVAINRNQIRIQLEQDVWKGDILQAEMSDTNLTMTSNVEGKKGLQIVLNAPKAQQLKKEQCINRIANAPLMRELEQYVSDERKLPLKGNLHLVSGELATFTLEVVLKDARYCVTVLGDMVETATGKPMDRETVFDKVSKTGGTRYVFETIDIQMSEDVFYPLKALKDLRRKAIAALEEKIIATSKRGRSKQDWNIEICAKFDEPVLQQTGDSVMVSAMEQYELVKREKCFHTIYLDMQYFKNEELATILEEAKNGRIHFVLPPIIRGRYQEELEEWIKTLGRKSPIGLVVRNIDELAMLKHFAFENMVVADYSLYAMNDWSAMFLKEQFPKMLLTIPVELNEKQIKQLQYRKNNSEIIVYGYQQLMVSQQCICNTVKGCRGKNPTFLMKDRYFKNFFIFSICKYCYNLIYNGIPTVLYDLMQNFTEEGMTKRFHFTRERAEEIRAVMKAYQSGQLLEGEKTRGHYKRGVE